jgi:hypothetical protein
MLDVLGAENDGAPHFATNTALAGGGQDYGLAHREYAPSKITGAFELRPLVHDEFTLLVRYSPR